MFKTPNLLYLTSCRRQACLAALANARQKAMEVCRMLGQTLGRPMSVKEETCQVEQDNQVLVQLGLDYLIYY